MNHPWSTPKKGLRVRIAVFEQNRFEECQRRMPRTEELPAVAGWGRTSGERTPVAKSGLVWAGAPGLRGADGIG